MAKHKTSTVPVAAAGVVASGGALVAGKLVRDRATDRKRRRRTRFALRPGEGAADGIRRIARGQLELSSERLEGARSKDLGEAIHETRKSFKRLRAVVRVAREALGDEVYRFENRGFRDAGRELSGARDAQVIRETLDALAARYEDELPKGAFAGLRETLEAEAEAQAAHERVRDDGGATDRLVATLDAAHSRVATWPLPDRDDWSLLAPGFARIYRRGRRAGRAAARHPTRRTSTSCASARRTCGTPRRSCGRRRPSSSSAWPARRTRSRTCWATTTTWPSCAAPRGSGSRACSPASWPCSRRWWAAAARACSAARWPGPAACTGAHRRPGRAASRARPPHPASYAQRAAPGAEHRL
jgi:hypothetical protein